MDGQARGQDGGHRAGASTRAAAAGRLAEVFRTFQGEGPHVGRRHLFVRLAGCDVGCRFCDTPDALRPGEGFTVRLDGDVARHANPVGADRAAEIVHDAARRSPPLHAVSVTGGEPLEQADFLADFLPRLAPLPVLLETAGTLPESLARVIDAVAIVSMDLKLPSVARTKPCLDEHRRFLRVALAREVYVKVVVNAGVDRGEWREAVAMTRDVAPGVPFVVQPETRRAGGLGASFELLSELADEASALGLRDVRVLPQVHKFLGAP